MIEYISVKRFTANKGFTDYRKGERMEITYLREFIELSTLLNYTEAAEKLYISQPVLSKHIKSLENELGFTLFDRNSKSVALTDFGSRYLPYAEKIVRQYEESETWRKEYANIKSTFVRMGLPESQELYEVEEHFQIFGKKYPEYRIDIDEMPSRRLKKRFEEGAINIFLTAMLVETDLDTLPYDYIEAAKGRIKVCIHREHPLAAKEKATIGDLQKERIILPPNDSVFQQLIENAFFKELGYRKEFLYSSYSMALVLAESGTCVAILQEEALINVPDELEILDLSPEIDYTRGLAVRKTDLNEAERAYADFVKEQFR